MVAFNFTTNGVDYSADAAIFEYTEHTMVSSLVPASGSAVGGTSVSVTGVNFGTVDSSMFCKFGAAAIVAATNVTPT